MTIHHDSHVRQVRIKRKLSTKELAAVLGVSSRTVESWEQGRRNPRGRIAKKIAALSQ